MEADGRVLVEKVPWVHHDAEAGGLGGPDGGGVRHAEQGGEIARAAKDAGIPIRIGVNGGSLNQELVMAKMQENTDRNLGKESDDIISECMVLSAVQSTELALETGLREDQIIISCKLSRPRHLIEVYRALAKQTTQPLHLGLTEAGIQAVISRRHKSIANGSSHLSTGIIR